MIAALTLAVLYAISVLIVRFASVYFATQEDRKTLRGFSPSLTQRRNYERPFWGEFKPLGQSSL